MKKTVYLVTLGVAIGIVIMQLIFTARIVKLESYDVLYKIRVTNDYINVRTQPTPVAKKMFEAVKNESYEVVEVFDEDVNYTWYKVIFSDRQLGWMASDKEQPWVEEVK